MATRVVIPSFGMYTVEATVAAWLAPPGSVVEEGQPIVEVTTDKASFEIAAPAAGRFQPVVELGQELAVEGVVALVLAPGETPEATPAAGGGTGAGASGGTVPAPAVPRWHEPAGGERQRISPLARRLAAELGVDLAKVVGSGPGGRIVEADVRLAAGGARGAEAP